MVWAFLRPSGAYQRQSFELHILAPATENAGAS